MFVKSVSEFDLPDDMLLRVNLLLYGVPEEWLHWFNTYHSFQKYELGLKPAAEYLCLLYTSQAVQKDMMPNPAAISCLQTDHFLIFANDYFAKLEENKCSQFERKDILKLAAGFP